VKRSRLRPVVLALLALVVGTGTYLLVSGDTVVAPPVVDAGTRVALPPLVVDAGPVELVAEGADAGDEHDPDAGVVALVDALDGGEDEDDDAGTLATKKLKRGRLTVLTTHKGDLWWADVTIDGDPKGRTPVNVWLEQGSYKVRVERPGMKTVSRHIWVASGKSKVVQIELRQ
jgi:PEGA domain